MKPLNKLALTAAVCVPGCFTMVHLFRRKVSSDIKNTKIYEEAIDILRHHKGAIYLLGQPISDFTAKYNSTGNKEKKRMDVKIEVSGPKSSGVLFYSTVADEMDKVQLDGVQLQIGKDETKRLLLKKSLEELNSNSLNNETSSNSSKNETSSSKNL